MASPAVQRITEVGQQAWPEVQRALDQMTRSIGELAGLAADVDTEVEIYFAKQEGGGAKRKAIVNETVWVLQRMGLLRSGSEAELVRSAIQVASELQKELPDEEQTPAERRFIKAVNALPDWKE